MKILQFLIFGIATILMWSVLIAILVVDDVKVILTMISSFSFIIVLLFLLVYKLRKVQIERRLQDIWGIIAKRNLLNSEDFENWYNSDHNIYGMKIYEIMNSETAFQKLKKDILTLDKVVLYDTVFK